MLKLVVTKEGQTETVGGTKFSLEFSEELRESLEQLVHLETRARLAEGRANRAEAALEKVKPSVKVTLGVEKALTEEKELTDAKLTEKAVEKAGGSTALSKVLKVNSSTVSKWKTGAGKLTEARRKVLEDFVGGV